ncbi:MAG: O-6-methylguanine DNA methyltransferase [Cellvibrionaceae bacterium]|jgi:O-6-methylguanine DNA methyltransferase
MAIYKQYLSSPVGILEIHANESSISQIFFVEEESPSNMLPNAVTKEAQRQLKAYFAGQIKVFDVPLQLKGTVFQKNIWHYLQQIPFGQTMSYRDVGQIAGYPKASRAIGSAIGRNPISIIIPCHRVIGRDGTLTGYSGGLERKAWLLEHEKIAFNVSS